MGMFVELQNMMFSVKSESKLDVAPRPVEVNPMTVLESVLKCLNTTKRRRRCSV